MTNRWTEAPAVRTGPALTLASNLALDEQTRERISRGEPIVHLGFGESQIPPHPGLVARLTEGRR